MRRYRFIIALVLSAGVVASGTATAAASEAHLPSSLSVAPRPTELPGICGTLVGGGVTAASLGKTVAARGAGWIGAIVSAGCLTYDLNEWGREQMLSPEGRATLQAIMDRYRNHTFEDFMREFDCTYVERTDLVVPDDVNSKAPAYWNCNTGRD
jgi:hypothetical protein